MTGKSFKVYCFKDHSGSSYEADWYSSNPQEAGTDSCHFKVKTKPKQGERKI